MLHESILKKGMEVACAEARKWLGATSPNPAVGAAALDGEGKILAVAAHQKAGELHAEAALIKHCRDEFILRHVHTLCITLEPCNHYGLTPPCTEAIIQSGIKHVVVGTRDPNPNVKGEGIERLQETGIEVLAGINEEECKQLIYSFAYRAKIGKPWITIKRAFDLNGSMIPPAGQKVFTSHSSLTLAHRLRKRSDAILTGSGTILADNPLFTVRHVSDFDSKTRFLAILDRRGRVPESYLKAALQHRLIPIVFQSLESAIQTLTLKGVQDVLVEAGPTLSQSVLEMDQWGMKMDIFQGDPDRIEIGFNPDIQMPFKMDTARLEYMLPA